MSIGILLNNVGPGQLAYYSIRAINHWVKANPRSEVVLFYSNMTPSCLSANCAIMHYKEAYSYDGTVISTDLESSLKLLSFPGPKRKLFYVCDLEWLRQKPRPYSLFAGIYNNPKLELLARGDLHANILRDVWNRDVKVFPDNELEKLFEYADH